MTFLRTQVAPATGRRWLRLCVALVPVAVAAPAGAQLQEALAAQVEADRAAAQSQNTINQLRERTLDAQGRAAEANATAESLERFNRQIEQQVRQQEQELASIQEQLVQIETTQREVEPLMQRMLDTLEQFIALDVPFLLDERTGRVQRLRNLMPRADTPISEKYRLILEAYQIELDYGRTLDAYEGRIGSGPDARTVEFARLGRVSLMYRTLDGSEVGYWDQNQKTWVVDNSYRDAVAQAIRVARRIGAAELLTVPVPAPQEVRS
jgi:hypothetical protein